MLNEAFGLPVLIWEILRLQSNNVKKKFKYVIGQEIEMFVCEWNFEEIYRVEHE